MHKDDVLKLIIYKFIFWMLVEIKINLKKRKYFFELIYLEIERLNFVLKILKGQLRDLIQVYKYTLLVKINRLR